MEADIGFDYYAPQTFEAPDGRRIVIGWMGMPDADYTNPTAKESGWQHAMSVPRELHWNGERITAVPVKELEQLHRNHRTVSFNGTLREILAEGADIQIRNDSLHLHVKLGDGAVIEYGDGLLTLTLTETSGCGRTRRVAEVGKLRNLRILKDTSSLELFLNDGEQVMSTRYYPQQADTLLLSGRGKAEIYDMEAMEFTYFTE